MDAEPEALETSPIPGSCSIAASPATGSISKSRWRRASSAMPRSRASAWQTRRRARRQPVPRLARHVCRRRLPEPRARGRRRARRAVRQARRRGPLPGAGRRLRDGTRLEADFWQMGLARRNRGRDSAHGLATCPATRPTSMRRRRDVGRRRFVGCRGVAGARRVRCRRRHIAALRPRRRDRPQGRVLRRAGCARRGARRRASRHPALRARLREPGFAKRSSRISPRATGAARRRFRASAATSASSSATCWKRRAISAPRALATGHYVRRVPGPDGPELHRARDLARDQSYFLYRTTRAELGFLRFPLGGLAKDETRALAREFGLPVADKPDSQDICFVPQGSYADIVDAAAPGGRRARRHRRPQGRVLGRHRGIAHFTVGQRKGLDIAAAEPLYVLRLDPETRRVVVGPRAALARTRIPLAEMNWLAPPPAPGTALRVAAKLRSAQPPVAGDGAGRGRRGRRRACPGYPRRRGRAGSGGGAVRRRPGARRRLDPPPAPGSTGRARRLRRQSRAGMLDRAGHLLYAVPRGPAAGRDGRLCGGVAQLVRAGES